MKRERNYVVRPDGKPINVPRQRGQIFVCEHGCCCGHTERGFAPVPHDLYYQEWERRKLRNKVHLNHAGCLGPCALANVLLLLFDGRPIWFHSLNDERLILSVYDYIDNMLEADRYLPPPADLAPHVFNGFAWDGTQGHSDQPLVEPPYLPDIESSLINLKSSILFLSHADTDLLALEQAQGNLPDDFPTDAGRVIGRNLLSLPTEEHVREFIRTELKDVQVIVLRSLGGRQGFAHGFDLLIQAANRLKIDLICVPGTEGLDPELTAHSTVPVTVIHDVYRYLQFGGVLNMQQMLHFLADHLLAGGWGYDQPMEMPRHGVYIGKSKAEFNPNQPTIGILFYRSHYLSGNTDFVDALIDAIEAAGGHALPVFTTSLKELDSDDSPDSVDTNGSASEHSPSPAAFNHFYDDEGTLLVDALISTISFAMGGINNEGITAPSWNVDALSSLGVPVLQAITSGMTESEWRLNQRGLRPLDVAMNVALPEFDGRIISVPISFKEENRYAPVPDRVEAVAAQAMRLATLRHKPNSEKRIAFVLTNSPGKADRIGNAVGLDTPASMLRLFEQMKAQGYQIENVPAESDALLHELIDRCSYDETILTEAQLAQAAGRVPTPLYQKWADTLTTSQQTKMAERWGAPPGEAYVHRPVAGYRNGRAGGQDDNSFIALAGLELGNVFVALQPPRGYGMDPDAIYHTPDLPPTHNYFALYRWLATPESEGGWGADAIVHMGKHGTLEWLPGKGVGLSQECFPDAFLAELPLIYPFIINNPGEGAQAKRRAHAVIVDHMIPPMTSADVYGELALLTQLVDEYYQVENMDPSKLPLVQKQIWELMQQANLDKDLVELMSTIDHGDHSHEWDGSFTDDGTPLTLAEMSGTDFAHLLEDIDGYLCELGSLQIRDGLHTLGHIPQGDQLSNLLRALTRIPNGDVPSLRAEVARMLGWELEQLLENRGKRLTGVAFSVTIDGTEKACSSHADIVEAVDELSLKLLQTLESSGFNPATVDQNINTVVEHVLIQRSGARRSPAPSPRLTQILSFVCTTLVPLIHQNDAEITNVLGALNGRYVPAGPAGAPTRGMAHILPTGRNFYALDPRAVPSQAAWRVGNQLADELIARYQKEEGGFPESVGISIWGTSAMRTHGDDIAQCFALLGVRPVWQSESRRIQDIDVIPLSDLGRPRVDVVMRISGFFRDAFPHLIDLMDKAAQLVANLEEPLQENFVRKHFLEDLAAQIAGGKTDEDAQRRASYRVFGSKPGAYGAGILPLIHEQNWEDENDLAQAYINWGGYAYGDQVYGDDAREEFRSTLGGVQVAVKNQDNREHDIFDSDDYLQYHGGMIAAIRSLNGRNPKSYFGDNSNPDKAEVRSLQQESHRVFRSRVINPKWIESIQRHGYKGALELSATVEYLFGYDATAQVVEDWMYEQTAQAYALDAEMQAFFQKSNPWALQSITERLLEAAHRGMWAEPDGETLDQLREIYRQMDETLEGRI